MNNFNFADGTALFPNSEGFDYAAVWGDYIFENIVPDYSEASTTTPWATSLEVDAPQEQEALEPFTFTTHQQPMLPAPASQIPPPLPATADPSMLGIPQNVLHWTPTIFANVAPPTFSYHFQLGGPLDTPEPMPSVSGGATRPHRSNHRFDPRRVGLPIIPSQPPNLPLNLKATQTLTLPAAGSSSLVPQKEFARGRPSGSRMSAYVPPEDFTSFARRFVDTHSPNPPLGFNTHQLMTLYANSSAAGVYTIAGWSQSMMLILDEKEMRGSIMFGELESIFNYFEHWGSGMTDLYRMSVRSHVLSSVVAAILEELRRRGGTA